MVTVMSFYIFFGANWKWNPGNDLKRASMAVGSGVNEVPGGCSFAPLEKIDDQSMGI